MLHANDFLHYTSLMSLETPRDSLVLQASLILRLLIRFDFFLFLDCNVDALVLQFLHKASFALPFTLVLFIVGHSLRDVSKVVPRRARYLSLPDLVDRLRSCVLRRAFASFGLYFTLSISVVAFIVFVFSKATLFSLDEFVCSLRSCKTGMTLRSP